MRATGWEPLYYISSLPHTVYGTQSSRKQGLYITSLKNSWNAALSLALLYVTAAGKSFGDSSYEFISKLTGLTGMHGQSPTNNPEITLYLPAILVHNKLSHKTFPVIKEKKKISRSKLKWVWKIVPCGTPGHFRKKKNYPPVQWKDSESQLSP